MKTDYVECPACHRVGIETCPVCHAQLPPVAMSDRPEPADIKCQVCQRPAHFIVHGRALCLEHRFKNL
jgi:hypothetical protein